jgi:cytochrome P450
MNEMMEAKKVKVSSGDDDTGLDLMGALVRNAGYGPGSNLEKGQSETLSDDEILGNAFVFILAGHETTANTIHYSLAFLAMNLKSQRHLQADLDQIFQGRPPSEWNYDHDLPKLFGGMTGAVMNEALRLIPPVVNIPKFVHADQQITIDGKEYKVPANTLVGLTTVAIHRNPRYWPSGKPPAEDEHWHPFSNHGDDLNTFRPERWLLNGDEKAAAAAASAEHMAHHDGKNAETEDLGVNTAADTSASLFKPVKGSYIPFSDGYRSCIGRRFAQVEVLAVLAVILQTWSVELAVDDFASDEEVARMTEAEKKELWKKVKRHNMETLRTKMGTIITIQLRNGEHIPLRFVKRGEERFNFEE